MTGVFFWVSRHGYWYRALCIGQVTSMIQWGVLVNGYNSGAEPLIDLGLTEDAIQRIADNSDTQSLAFMVDLLPTFWGQLTRLPRRQEYSVLDIGPGSGAGTELLARIHSSSFLGYPLVVDTFDISQALTRYLQAFAPNVRQSLVGDIFKSELSYDFCICSHVIEHVSDPAAFVHRLREIAKYAVIIAAPLEEPSSFETTGHVNVFTEDSLREYGATEIRTVNSFGWANWDDNVKVFVAVFPGRV